MHLFVGLRVIAAEVGDLRFHWSRPLLAHRFDGLPGYASARLD
jgi:hypothetical protein